MPGIFIKKFAGSQEKPYFYRFVELIESKEIKFTMQQRRMNNRTNLSDQGIKCLEGMSHVHTSGIETFNTYCEIFRLTFDRTSGIQ